MKVRSLTYLASFKARRPYLHVIESSVGELCPFNCLQMNTVSHGKWSSMIMSQHHIAIA